MKLRKTVSVLAALALCFALAACGYNPETVGSVLTADGSATDIPCGVYLTLQFAACSKALYAVDSTGATTLATLLDGGTVEDADARAWIAAETEKGCQRYAAVEQLYDALGLEMSESDLYYYDYAIRNSWNTYYSTYTANGIGFDSFRAVQMNTVKESEVTYALLGVGGELELSEDWIAGFLEDNAARFDYIKTPSTKGDSSALTDDDKAALAAKAEALRKAAEVGGLEAAWQALAPEYASALGAEQSSFSGITSGALALQGDGSFDYDMMAAVLALPQGGYTLYDNGDGSFYLVRRAALTDADTVDALRDRVISVVGAERFESYLADYTAGWSVQHDTRAEAYYSLDKVRLS